MSDKPRECAICGRQNDSRVGILSHLHQKHSREERLNALILTEQPMEGCVPVEELRELVDGWEEISGFSDVPDGHRTIFAVCANDLQRRIHTHE